MEHDQDNQTGLTKDSGWQIGLRRTFALPADLLWDWMLSKEGMAIWLGRGADLQFQIGEEYLLDDGTAGKVRTYKTNSHWRISRRPNDSLYKRPSVMQIRILDSGEKSVLAFHEEYLPTRNERQKRKSFYLGVIEKIKEELGII